MSKYKRYRKERLLFFWLTIIVYFVPVIAVTASLLPLIVVSPSMKWGIGCAVLILHSLVFVCGIFRKFLAHFPFFNGWAIIFTALSYFFTARVFSEYVYTFRWIATTMAISSIVACVLWIFYNKYKREDLTLKTMNKAEKKLTAANKGGEA